MVFLKQEFRQLVIINQLIDYFSNNSFGKNNINIKMTLPLGFLKICSNWTRWCEKDAPLKAVLKLGVKA